MILINETLSPIQKMHAYNSHLLVRGIANDFDKLLEKPNMLFALLDSDVIAFRKQLNTYVYLLKKHSL